MKQSDQSQDKPNQKANDPSLSKPKKSRFAKLFKRGKMPETDLDTEILTTERDELQVVTLTDQGTSAPVTKDTFDSTDVIVETVKSTATTVEQGLEPSRKGLLSKISHVFKGSFDLTDELFDELEESLIASDLGVAASLNLVERLQERVRREKIQDANGVIRGLSHEIAELLHVAEQDWPMSTQPHVILIVGVNGVGKTTTIAKIASHLKRQGKSVMLAAGDTFRAAAVQQLQQWGQRLEIPVVAQGQNADAAAVAHDALTAARAKDIDVLLIDTAGRLHTQTDLMEQLQKVRRVLTKIDPDSPHEVMQILDAGTGQNALSQLEHFKKAVTVSSLCLTKLDGSARGGVAVALTEKYKLPIRFVGVGEGENDLRRFNAAQFADGLIPSSNN